MDGTAEIYHASPYSPIGAFTKFHDCKMATLYEEQQNRSLYYEYSPNHLMNPSVYDSITYIPNDVPSHQSRIHAYDYQLWPNSDVAYENVRLDQPDIRAANKKSVYCDQNGALVPRSKSQRSLSKSRSKSGDRRRSDSRHNNYEYIDSLPSNNPHNSVHPSLRNRSLSTSIVHDGKIWRENIAPAMPTACCDFAHADRNRGELRQVSWQQMPWFTRDGYYTAPGIPPSSPLDSGLSSQSVASSPSLETEPFPSRIIQECGSPLPLTSLQQSQCSCSTNSFADSNILSPIIRTDSGRSSPWAQSAIMRLNALTRSKTPNVPHIRPVDADTENVAVPEIDHRRYSMSGIYIAPKNQKNCRKSSGRSNKNGNDKVEKYGSVIERSSSYGYEYIDDGGTIKSRKSRHFKQLHIDAVVPIKRAGICGLNPLVQENEKSPEPESSVSLPTSRSTDMSSPASNKSEHKNIRNLKKTFKNNEKAICELEEMYKKLNLQDSDLLDRAERRDLPTQHQLPRMSAPTLTRSKSDSFYEILGPNFCTPYRKSQRAPPMRRAGIPDVVADDMAIRKWQRPFKSHQMNPKTASYMLYSSHFTPSIPAPNDILMTNKPDIEYDDLSYRRFFQTITGKSEEPQPPFGIPLKPLPPQSIFSDYLHVVPSSYPQPLCHPRGNPDLVRDDLAFRTLRKDDPERTMYDSYSLYYRKLR